MFNAVGSGNRGNPDVTDVLANEILRPERQRGSDPNLFNAWRVDYPAVSVASPTGLGAVFRLPGRYYRSVVQGKNWLRQHVNDKIEHCGAKTRIILSGYSQGAQVVGDIYQELEKSGRAGYIFGVVLFGDPYFNPTPDGRGSSQGKWGPARERGRLGERPPYGRYTRSYLSRIRSYCHKKDPVCQVSAPVWFADHENYGKTGPGQPGEATDAGRWLSTQLRAVLGLSGGNGGGGSGPVDISYYGGVGAVTIGVSTVADITGALGAPDRTASGSFDNAGVSYEMLGYDCHGDVCVTEYYVNLATGRLTSFETTSDQFVLPGGVRVGMSAAAASRRERRPVALGCAGIGFTKARLVVLLRTRGGRRLANGQVAGGRVAGISLDDRDGGVGVTFC